MSAPRPSHRLLTVLLVFGALVFGMVLAGALNWTPAGVGAPEEAPAARPAAVPASTPPALPSFADLVEHVAPAVVSIEASSFERSGRGRAIDPFEFFFGPRRRRPQPEEDPQQEFRSDSGGSGFVISEDGYVVTNNHVIRGAEQVRVRIGERTYDAEIKGSDPATDLALLKIDPPRNLAALPLGDSDRLRVGDWVMAIGSPQGLADTVTVGVVSAKGRRINISQETSSFEDFIQTDAAINFGNSGGPLLNLDGEVVGINTAINWGSENIGFAVPVNILQRVLPQLKESGRVRRGYLGIGVNDVTERAAEAFGLDASEGALVTNVLPGLPADKAGIRPGDVIVKVDDVKVRDTRDLIDYVSSRGPEVSVKIDLVRDGKRMTRSVDLTERPSEGGAPPSEGGQDEGSIEWLGLRYQDLTPGLRSMHGLPEDLEGVWVTDVSPRSPLYDEGLRGGDVINVITEVNGTPVGSVAEFERLIRASEPGSRLRIYVRRFMRGQEIQPLFVFPAVP